MFSNVRDVNEHFRGVGMVLGLVRIKDLHLGIIDDLKEQTKVEQEKEQNDTI